MGEAPPPERFFYFANSNFFRYFRRALAEAVPETEDREADEVLALCREADIWHIDVCETAQRATKGGSEDVTPCWESFRPRWEGQALRPDAVIVVSPKRLAAKLPEWIGDSPVIAVPPPGQWNAHREAFLREVRGLLLREFGETALQKALGRVDPDDARLDFEIAGACRDGAPESEILRLLNGHPREAALTAAWNGV